VLVLAAESPAGWRRGRIDAILADFPARLADFPVWLTLPVRFG
jgi:hypothetical protein